MTPVIQGYFSPNIRNKGQILELYELLCLCNYHTAGPGNVRCTSDDQNRPVQPETTT